MTSDNNGPDRRYDLHDKIIELDKAKAKIERLEKRCEELALLLTEELEVQEGVMEPIQVARIKQALKSHGERQAGDE